MASNKNQHFVPKVYLRPFTVAGEERINLFNVDLQEFIKGASLKHQCARNYFYGKNPQLERAIQATEGAYGTTLRAILQPGYILTDKHRHLLRLFWLFQHLRTEETSKRAVEMNEATHAVVGKVDTSFRLEMREAVQIAMDTFAESMDIVDDLKVCLVKNRSNTPFITSDYPAILTNRWYIEDNRTRGSSFGIRAAGVILLLPLNPQVLCLGYDGDVYSIPHKSGWTELRRDSDVEAFNQHQFLNCNANVYVQDTAHAKLVHESFMKIAARRPTERHRIHYAVLDQEEDNFERYRVVNRAEAEPHQKAMVHSQVIQPAPITWPRQISWRRKGVVFTNGSGVGYVRKASTNRIDVPPFRKEYAR